MKTFEQVREDIINCYRMAWRINNGGEAEWHVKYYPTAADDKNMRLQHRVDERTTIPGEPLCFRIMTGSIFELDEFSTDEKGNILVEGEEVGIDEAIGIALDLSDFDIEYESKRVYREYVEFVQEMEYLREG